MSGLKSRRKGASGEREAFALLSEYLGSAVHRNIGQARSGGADGLEVPGWAIEVKRVEREALGAWWNQALRQAEDTQRKPMLMWRASRRPWQCMVRLADIYPDTWGSMVDEVAVISPQAWAALARDGIGAIPDRA